MVFWPQDQEHLTKNQAIPALSSNSEPDCLSILSSPLTADLPVCESSSKPAEQPAPLKQLLLRLHLHLSVSVTASISSQDEQVKLPPPAPDFHTEASLAAAGEPQGLLTEDIFYDSITDSVVKPNPGILFQIFNCLLCCFVLPEKNY